MEVLSDVHSENDQLTVGGDESEDNEEVDDNRNARLLESLSSLSRNKRNKETQRTEPSTVVSDFHLSNGSKKVYVNELLKSLNCSAKFSLSKKQLRKAAKKTKLLNVPLAKPAAEKIKRTVAYNNTKRELSKWDSVVNKNRRADCLVFPLHQPVLNVEPTSTFVKKFQAKTPLELEVAKLLSGSDSHLTEEQLLTPAEERAMKAMSLEEARERLQELRKMRALLSYQEARARRQNKIKSKRYHRILKKDRLKKQIKEFELLKSSDPEKALEKLQELDKRRIEERLTLKHKNTGKWAKQNALRSKYDKQARDALSEQLELNRQLTQKVVPVSSDEESDLEPEENKSDDKDMTDSNATDFPPDLPATYNAWLRNPTSTPLPAQTTNVSTKPKLIRVISKSKKQVTVKHRASEKVSEKAPAEKPQEDVEEPEVLCETFNNKPLEETSPDPAELEVVKSAPEEPPPTKPAERQKTEDVLVDPSKFIGAKPKVLLSKAPALIDSEDEGLDRDEKMHMTIREAFADDDVIEEFKNAKEDAVNAGKPKDIDLFLPGWGDWAGSGIVPSKRKRRRFLVKAPPAPPRKDQVLGNVIINEEKETHISKHMVSELPFPFQNVQQFEKTIAHPVGSTWNTQNSFQELIRPEVIVKKGKIIEPISSDEILKNKPTKLAARRNKKKF